MAIRKNTFLIKRSNIPGKIPSPGDLQLGELALSTSDVILYASGTTANSILPIGWDRVSKTGDTMSGTLYTPTISATTYLNYPITTFTGGTVSGATNFTGGLTANTLSATTISVNNYIDFNTGTTSPTNISGRVFYDNQSHSLAYYPDINQNVKVEMGQQLYIRGFNNTGTIIPKGSVLSIQSATNGLPNFTLAVISHTGFSQVIGLAASDIPINGNGLALSQGILSGITINTFNVGDILYASPFSAGTYVASTSNFPFSARTNQIGFVTSTGTTNGQIYVSINNEDENLTLTDIERNILEGNVISTGTYEFTGITTYSTTTINVAPMRGWLVRNTYSYATLPDVLNLYYTGGTNISLPNIGTADSTYLLVNSGATLYQQTTFPTPQERRENIYLGKVNHPNRSTISSINNTVDFDVSPMSALRDLWTPLKLINQGILVSANGANLNINTSAGTLWGNGIGWITSQLNPDSISISGTSPTTFQYRVQTGGTFSNTTTIDVSHYDLNGVVTAVGGGAGSSTNQRVYLFPTGLVRIQYGQTVYGTLAAAVAGVQTESFVEYPNNRDNAILIGVISVNKNATLLNNTGQAVFTLVSKFGELLGGTGGLSTTTLQQAYDNSTTPEIVTNSTLGALSIKNGAGTADNITILFEGQTSTNGVTSFISADGYISGTTFQSNGFIGNNGGATATTLNIITLGSGTSIANLGVDVTGRVVTGTTGGSTFTGGTVNGATIFTNGLTANTISATTYYNLPTDVYSTGGTYNGSNLYITNNTGGTFTITGLTATGFSANYYGSFSDTTIQAVTGVSSPTVWKYNTTELSNGISVVNGSQIKVANKGVYEIGYSAQLEKTQGTQADITIWASINGIPVTRSSSITSLVANSALQLPFVSYIFELNANDYVEFYFSSPNQYVQISTYSGLTTPTRPDAPSVIIVAKQVGLSVTDNLGGYYLPLSGGTVTGGTSFNSGLTANTISATTYYNLPTDIRVTGSTYSNNTFTYTNNTGGTFNVLFDTLTGLTITGDLTVTGGTRTRISGNSSSELVLITQTGSGDAFVVEDSANADSSHFVINASGDTAIGLSQPLGGDKLSVSGNTGIYGTLKATTISATTYQNLPTFSLTYFTESGNTATPNGTVPVVSLSATSATTNVDFAIIPKGTGSLLAAIPDNATTGGNKRGNNAIDLQMVRGNSSQVANGTNAVTIGNSNTASASSSFAFGRSNSVGSPDSVSVGSLNSVTGAGNIGSVAIGYNNSVSVNGGVALGTTNTVSTTATGYAVAIGQSNTASGTNSSAMGYSNAASGNQSVALGYQNTSSGRGSVAICSFGSTFGVSERFTQSTFGYVLGDAQKSVFLINGRTTTTGATTLTAAFSQASTPSATNQVVLQNNNAFRFKGVVIGKQSGSANVAAWDIDGLIVRGANAASTTLLVNNVTLVQNTPGFGTPTLSANTTIGCLTVQVTGILATNIQWTCSVETTEVIYA
jgi:hypothetical protein